ncbi:ATP synthase epsilon chain [Thelohanellus kitauei]|uniref:ATP synthase epsilon chain n=1 Tax=Thelohanellus kitauei TaxID=669202 RepID=A0A0C2J631_THEKT|nr:ATP synthase epsilon chain [Thelohanellus kitauei]
MTIRLFHKFTKFAFNRHLNLSRALLDVDKSGLLSVSLLTPTKILFNGHAKQIDAETVTGAVGIFPKHVPSIFMLVPGTMTIFTETQNLKVLIASGVLSINENSVVNILTSEAELFENVSKQSIEQEIKQLEKGLDESKIKENNEDSSILQILKTYQADISK